MTQSWARENSPRTVAAMMSRNSEQSPLLSGNREHLYTHELPDPEVAAQRCGCDTSFCCLCVTKCRLSWVRSASGYLLIIVAGLLFTLSNVIQKMLAPSLNFWHLLLLRAVAQALPTGLFAAYCAGPGAVLGPTSQRWRLLIQGILGGTLLLCIFVAIKHVPLGNSSAIFFCTPVFTFAFAVCMLREPLGLYRMLISLLMLSGVVLITRPPFLFHSTYGQHDVSQVFSPIGYVCAVLVPLLSAIISILTRQLKDIHASIVMFWFASGTFIIGCGGLLATKSFNLFSLSLDDYLYSAAIITLGILGNLSYTFAVRFVSPSKGNVFRSFEVILNYVLQLLLEHSQFYWTSVGGIALLLAAVVFTGLETEAMQKFGHICKYL